MCMHVRARVCVHVRECVHVHVHVHACVVSRSHILVMASTLTVAFMKRKLLFTNKMNGK